MEEFVLLLVIVLCILIVVLGIVAMIQFGEIAVLKGFPEKKTVVMVLCFFVPIAGYLLVCALPDHGQKGISTETPASESSIEEEELPDL